MFKNVRASRTLTILFALIFALSLMACGGGGTTTPGGTTPQEPTGTAPLITAMSIGTVTGDNVSVTLTVAPGDNCATNDAWLEISQDNVNWTPTAVQTFGTGAPATLTFSLSSLPVGVTYISGRAGNNWGADIWNEGGSVTVASPPAEDNVTININMAASSALIIFRDNVEVQRFNGSGSGFPAYNYSGLSGNYKISYVLGYTTAAAKPYTLCNLADNNAFRLSPGAIVNLGSPQSATNGRVAFDISGTGFTSSYEAPGNYGGAAWNMHALVTHSTQPTVDNGATSDYIDIWSQTENLATINDAVFGTVTATINGKLMYVWWAGTVGPWNITYEQIVVVNADGTSMSGTTEETWTAVSGTANYVVRSNITGTR